MKSEYSTCRQLLLSGSAAAALAVSFQGVALADDVTISSDLSDTYSFSLADSTLTIESGVTVETTSGHGVNASAGNQTVINYGTISADSSSSFANADGIRSSGANATITNSGTIIGDDDGVQLSGDYAILTNTGTITADYGVFSLGDEATITNLGTIEADEYSILSTGDTATITNTGTITTNHTGILSTGYDDKITNTGMIEEGYYGISSSGENVTITNTGTITTDESGIYSTGANASIINTGIISGESYAGIESIGASITIINTGTITSESADGIYSADSFGSTADNATITNTGTISAGNDGIHSGGDNATITNTGTINGGDDGIQSDGGTATITNTGTITADLDDGIQSDGNNATITNIGTITADYGVYSLGDDATITNTGTITANDDGIYSIGDVATLTNTGTIAVTDDVGIYSNGDAATLSNTGTITVTGTFGDGINSSGNNATINNTGTITVTGDSGINSSGDTATLTNAGTVTAVSYGAFSTGDSATLTNTGTITADIYGIFSSGDNATLTNTGTITATFGTGIWTNGADATVINAGTIKGDDYAIKFNGNKDSTLILESGSRIIGDVSFGGIDDDGDTLTFSGPMESMALTYETSDNVTVDFDGKPGVTACNAAGTECTALAVDPTAFSLADDVLADTTGVIQDAVLGRILTANLPNIGNGTVATPASVAHGNGMAVWAQTFGSYRSQDGDSDTLLDAEHYLGGAVAGIDMDIGPDLRGGIFVGGSAGEVNVPDSQEIDVDTVFGGLYASVRSGIGTLLGFSVIGGVMMQDSSRTVADNTSSTGEETVKADYDGVFISPELAVSQLVDFAGRPIRLEGRLGYAGLFLDGYEETGSSSDLTVGAREVHLAKARAQVAVPMTMRSDESGRLIIELRFGADARTSLGGDDVDVAVTISGASSGLSGFDSGDKTVVSGFVGPTFGYKAVSGMTFHGSLEGSQDTDANSVIQARLGAKIPF